MTTKANFNTFMSINNFAAEFFIFFSERCKNELNHNSRLDLGLDQSKNLPIKRLGDLLSPTRWARKSMSAMFGIFFLNKKVTYFYKIITFGYWPNNDFVPTEQPIESQCGRF